MTTPLFGEFLAAASEHIDAAVSFPGELPGRARPAAIWQLGRLLSALARCAADVTPADALDPAGPPPAAHEQAAAAPRLALLNAAGHAQLAARAGATGRAAGGHPVAVHLAGAADHLAAGRDLLQTHLTAAGTGAGSSPWAPVITSPPVTTALIAELARYAHRLAPWMSQLALARTPDPAVPAPACLAPHTASGWLRAAGPAMVTAAAAPAAGGRPQAARRHPRQHPAATVPARRHRNDRRAVRWRRQHRRSPPPRHPGGRQPFPLVTDRDVAVLAPGRAGRSHPRPHQRTPPPVTRQPSRAP
jgi:hypothetical protein